MLAGTAKASEIKSIHVPVIRSELLEMIVKESLAAKAEAIVQPHHKPIKAVFEG